MLTVARGNLRVKSYDKNGLDMLIMRLRNKVCSDTCKAKIFDASNYLCDIFPNCLFRIVVTNNKQRIKKWILDSRVINVRPVKLFGSIFNT